MTDVINAIIVIIVENAIYVKNVVNVIIAKKFEEFTQYNLVFKHKTLSPEKIRVLLGKTYTMYYGRFSWALKFLKNSILA